MDAMNEDQLRARLAKAEARLAKIRVWQKTYYNKKKDVICKRNRGTYHQKKEEILARRRELYAQDPHKKEKRRARYLRDKARAERND